MADNQEARIAGPGRKRKRDYSHLAIARAHIKPPQQCVPIVDPPTTTRQLRSNPPSLRPTLSDASKGVPYSMMLGTTSQALTDHVAQIWALIDKLCAGDWVEQRRAELMTGFMTHPRTQLHIPLPRHYDLLAQGLK